MRILWSSVLGNGVFAPWLVKLNYGVRMWSSREAEVCVCVCVPAYVPRPHTALIRPPHPPCPLHSTSLPFPLDAVRNTPRQFFEHISAELHPLLNGFPFFRKNVATAFRGFN